MNAWGTSFATALLVLLPAAARAELVTTSRLALPAVTARADAGGLLAQRVIDREWGLSEDSTYHVVEVPGWKSEGLALGLSGVVPGAGQLYDGESSGWLYAAAEVASWTGRWFVRRKANRELDDAARLVGNPYDSSSTFSFARYERNGGGTVTDLQTLWSANRNGYYRALIANPGYRVGFGTDHPDEAYQAFDDMLTAHDNNLHHEQLLETVLWINHIVAAVDALRAARVHNMPLREEYHLELGERLQHGRPALRAAVVRRF